LLNKLLKVVPNPGHARQTVRSPHSGGIGGPPALSTMPLATPFDVERHGVHVDPHTWTECGLNVDCTWIARGLRVTECGLDHPDGPVPTVGVDEDGGIDQDGIGGKSGEIPSVTQRLERQAP
jgi:hypothetical protein